MSGKPGALLEVTDLVKAYAGIRAVDGLSFSIAPGEVVGLIGPNGCGKSTSIDCITGFTPRSSGTVEFGGRDLSGRPAEAIAASGMVRTFQNVRVYDRLSLLENLATARHAFDGLPWWAAYMGGSACRAADRLGRERAKELIVLVGLDRMAGLPAGFLSYGQKKLLALAMTLMSDPQLVILDEPLAGVNPTVVRRVSELIARLNAGGITFLIVEHNVQFIMQHCRRVIVMEQGRVLASGPPSLIREDERVLRAYLGSARNIEMELAFHA